MLLPPSIGGLSSHAMSSKSLCSGSFREIFALRSYYFWCQKDWGRQLALEGVWMCFGWAGEIGQNILYMVPHFEVTEIFLKRLNGNASVSFFFYHHEDSKPSDATVTSCDWLFYRLFALSSGSHNLQLSLKTHWKELAETYSCIM